MKSLKFPSSKAPYVKIGALVLGSTLLLGLAGCTAEANEPPVKDLSPGSSATVDVNETPKNAPEVIQSDPRWEKIITGGSQPMSEENFTKTKALLEKALPGSLVEGPDAAVVYPPYETFDKPALESLLKQFTDDGWEILPELLDTGLENKNSYSVYGFKDGLRLAIFNNGENMALVTISELVPND